MKAQSKHVISPSLIIQWIFAKELLFDTITNWDYFNDHTSSSLEIIIKDNRAPNDMTDYSLHLLLYLFITLVDGEWRIYKFMVIINALKLGHIILLIINAAIYNAKIAAEKQNNSVLNVTLDIFYLPTSNVFNAITLGFIWLFNLNIVTIQLLINAMLKMILRLVLPLAMDAEL